MFCIGLIGRIASGKSTVARHFEKLGVPVISADAINHELLMTDGNIHQAIVTYFGPRCLSKNQCLDKSFLRRQLLQVPQDRKWLETLLHPLIREKIGQEIARLSATNMYPYCIVEIPLLIRREDYPYLQHILLIDAEETMQHRRLLRRGHAWQASQSWVALQASRQQYAAMADEVILNTGSRQALKRAVHALHQRYVQESV